jgi:hypothetical protein
MRTPRLDFKLEIEKEVVRLVNGQRQSKVGASLGISDQTPSYWVKVEAAGRFLERRGFRAVSEERIDIIWLKAEQARVRRERDTPKMR